MVCRLIFCSRGLQKLIEFTEVTGFIIIPNVRTGEILKDWQKFTEDTGFIITPNVRTGEILKK